MTSCSLNFHQTSEPLDKTVFKTMKTDWNQLVIEHNRKFPGKLLTKAQFAEFIGTLWEDSFKSRNLRSGFESTGLFPINFNRFPETAFDPIKLERFRNNESNDESNHSTQRQSSHSPPPVASASSSPTISEDVPGPSHRLTAAEEAHLKDQETEKQAASTSETKGRKETGFNSLLGKNFLKLFPNLQKP